MSYLYVDCPSNTMSLAVDGSGNGIATCTGAAFVTPAEWSPLTVTDAETLMPSIILIFAIAFGVQLLRKFILNER